MGSEMCIRDRKIGLFLALLSFNVPADACPMADAAAYKAAAQQVKATKGTHVAFNVTGMSCGDCSEKINTAIKAIDGVMASAVDYQTGEARVAFDAKKTDEAAILAAIHGTGFKAKKAKVES